MNICTLESNNQKRFGLKAAVTRGSLDGPNDGPRPKGRILDWKKMGHTVSAVFLITREFMKYHET